MSGITSVGSSSPISLSNNRPLIPTAMFVSVTIEDSGVYQSTIQLGTTNNGKYPSVFPITLLVISGII